MGQTSCLWRATTFVCLMTLIPACGGGSGGSAPPPGPTYPDEIGAMGGAHSGTLFVRVLDERLGLPINGATISLGQTGTVSTTTDSNGLASFSGLASGSPQILSAAMAGYQTLTYYALTAPYVTFALNPLSWTFPQVAGGVSGITLGTSGYRGYVRCNRLASISDGNLVVPDTTTDLDLYNLVVLANKPAVLAATQEAGGDNFVMASIGSVSSGTQLLVQLTFPFPAATPTALGGGNVTLPASLGGISSGRIRMNLYPVGSPFVETGTGTLNTGTGAYTLKYYTNSMVDLYQGEVSATGTLGSGSGYFNSATPPASLSAVSIPNVPSPMVPSNGAIAVGSSPGLAWTAVSGASLYSVSMAWTDGGNPRGWRLFMPGPSSAIPVPVLPAAVAGQGLTSGNAVSWEVRVSIAAAFDYSNFTETSLLRSRTGETVSLSGFAFTP